MQFRKVGRKIQCLVPMYDPASKRTRQKMVYSFDTFYAKIPDAAGLSLGDADQRAAWTEQITIEIQTRKEADAARSRTALPSSFGRIIDRLVQSLSSGEMSSQEIEEIRGHAHRLSAELRRIRRKVSPV